MPRSTNQPPTLTQFLPEMIKGRCIDSTILINRVLEGRNAIQREAQYVAIASEEVCRNLSALLSSKSVGIVRRRRTSRPHPYMLCPCFAEDDLARSWNLAPPKLRGCCCSLSQLRALHRTQAEAKRCSCCATPLQPPHTFIRGCVRPWVSPRVSPSVRPSVCNAFVKNA